MTGLECLKEEMLKRGCTKGQIDSKLVPIVLDIVAQSGGVYQDIAKLQDDYEYQKKRVLAMEREHEKSAAAYERERRSMQSELRALQDKKRSDLAYIDEFNRALSDCETPEGRDIMRAAQMFVQTVDVDTKYDNTAYIVGLASILSGGHVGAINELRKINKKIPHTSLGTI